MSDSRIPLCLACNYPLNGLESRNCPECGREFDLSNSESVNFGRPLGSWGRSLVDPVGWPSMLIAVVAIGGLLCITRWPGFWPSFWLGEFREASGLVLSKALIDPSSGLSATDRIWIAFVGIWWIAALWFLLREVARLIVLIIMRPGKLLRPRRARRRVFALLLLSIGLALMGFGWPYRRAVRSVDEYFASLNRPASLIAPTPRYEQVESDQQHARSVQIVRAELSALPDSRSRKVGLMDLIHNYCPEALPILLDRAQREKDTEIRIAEIHLIGIHRDVTAVGVLTKLLDAPDTATRAAAIDAIGIIYSPAYRIPNGDANIWSGGELNISPSIELHNIAELVARRHPSFSPDQNLPLNSEPIPMPPALRDRLAGLMQNAAALDEREAAARAILKQPPAEYKLRYAEWGVWLASAKDHVLTMPAGVEDEIPPFVHRMGNTSASLRDHVMEKIIIINKPVIHLTASALMAVDLETQIYLGRPWFAYPKPDDFSVGVESHVVGFGEAIIESVPAKNTEKLAALDKSGLANLPDAREGYPWLLPAHRQRDTPGTNTYNNLNVMNALGVHWQSLIVTPQKLPWMQPPVVPADPKYTWWSRLRDVDCSWVSSRGESERFLYYDGPTVAPTISEVYIDPNQQLRFSPNAEMPLAGLLIEVKNGDAKATIVQIAPASLAYDLKKLKSEFKPDARGQLAAMLLKEGLRPTEAEGLLDCWSPQFFKTQGLRFILIFGTLKYNEVCPMNLHPRETERVRVGLQLNEFEK